MSSTHYFYQNVMKLEFCRQIWKKNFKSNNLKVHPVGAELFDGDGRTDGQTRRSWQSRFAT